MGGTDIICYLNYKRKFLSTLRFHEIGTGPSHKPHKTRHPTNPTTTPLADQTSPPWRECDEQPCPDYPVGMR
jgi:hypothetical protein